MANSNTLFEGPKTFNIENPESSSIEESNTALLQLIEEVGGRISEITVGSVNFEMLNFAESLLWLHALGLVNERGLPENIESDLTDWAVGSFRLEESTQKARALRKGLVLRKECMETNRSQGVEGTWGDLMGSYLLLVAFQKFDSNVVIPEVMGTLRGALLKS